MLEWTSSSSGLSDLIIMRLGDHPTRLLTPPVNTLKCQSQVKKAGVSAHWRKTVDMLTESLCYKLKVRSGQLDVYELSVVQGSSDIQDRACVKNWKREVKNKHEAILSALPWLHKNREHRIDLFFSHKGKKDLWWFDWSIMKQQTRTVNTLQYFPT